MKRPHAPSAPSALPKAVAGTLPTSAKTVAGTLLRAVVSGALALGVAAVGGCAQSADAWLASRTIPPLDAAVPDAAPELPVPVGPTVVDVRRVEVPSVEAPRGLAHDGTHRWITDRADDTLVPRDARTGAEVGRAALPARGAVALAATSDAVLVGYPEALYRFRGVVDDGRFERIDGSFDGLGGVAATDEAVITIQDGGLYVRDRGTLAARFQVNYTGEGRQLVQFGADYLIYVRSRSLDGATYSGLFTVADATRPTQAEVRGGIELPVDASRITGMAVMGGALWALGAGHGEDAGRVVIVELAPEPQR